MRNLPFFRRKLAHHLRSCAARRHAACLGDPTGEDLKVIALFERLARDAEHLPQALVDTVAQLCADPVSARRFDHVWETMGDTLGVLLCPASAIALVQWMVDQARHDAGEATRIADPPSELGTPAAPVVQGPGRSALTRNNPVVSIADDFTGALAVVGPMLAVWSGATAIGQWRDQAFAASHAAVPATVVSVAGGDAGRADVPPLTETLAFTPADGSLPCRVPVQLGRRQSDPLGQSLTVVPRSSGCEAPLVPGTIGDPIVSVTVALAFLASGAAALKAWTWLRRGRLEAASSMAGVEALLEAAAPCRTATSAGNRSSQPGSTRPRGAGQTPRDRRRARARGIWPDAGVAATFGTDVVDADAQGT